VADQIQSDTLGIFKSVITRSMAVELKMAMASATPGAA